MTKNIDDSTCPLCQQQNRCEVQAAQAGETCWCMNTQVPAELLAKIPENLRNKICICNACIVNFQQNKTD